MAENTKIEWADHTFNPWMGCTKVSEGCRNCYAEADFDKRRHLVEWGPGKPRVRTTPDNWKKPLAWNRKAEKDGTRTRVFCASLADWLDPEVPIEWLADLLVLIEDTSNLDWLLLTKRPELWRDQIGRVAVIHGSPYLSGSEIASRWLNNEAPPNVWIGTTVENQKATSRIPHLLSIPARVRFLSCEPLLGPVDLTPAFVNLIEQVNTKTGKTRTVDLDGAVVAHAAAHARKLNYCDSTRRKPIDWVICGGESGQGDGIRPMHPDWARSLRDQCEAAGVPFHFKQWGEFSGYGSHNGLSGTDYTVLSDGAFYPSAGLSHKDLRQEHKLRFQRLSPMMMCRCGKKAAGRLLDGREWNELPKPSGKVTA